MSTFTADTYLRVYRGSHPKKVPRGLLGLGKNKRHHGENKFSSVKIAGKGGLLLWRDRQTVSLYSSRVLGREGKRSGRKGGGGDTHGQKIEKTGSLMPFRNDVQLVSPWKPERGGRASKKKDNS